MVNFKFFILRHMGPIYNCVVSQKQYIVQFAACVTLAFGHLRKKRKKLLSSYRYFILCEPSPLIHLTTSIIIIYATDMINSTHS